MSAGRERSFGLSVGGVLMLIGAALAWRGRLTRGEVVGLVGATLFVLAWIAPPVLAVPTRLWFKLAHALGWVNARVLLAVAFALILIPIGALWRLRGRDPLALSRAQWPGWSRHPKHYRNTRHYEKMY